MPRQRRLVRIAESLLVASMLSTAIRTHFGRGPSNGTLAGNIIGIATFGAPSLVMVAVTRRWRIWALECLLSAPWLLIGVRGDFSGVDEGFVFAIPFALALPQLALFVLALLTPGMRRSSPNNESPERA